MRIILRYGSPAHDGPRERGRGHEQGCQHRLQVDGGGAQQVHQQPGRQQQPLALQEERQQQQQQQQRQQQGDLENHRDEVHQEHPQGGRGEEQEIVKENQVRVIALF